MSSKILSLLTAWFALSSCLGDSIRARISGITVNPRHGSYGRTYGRNASSGVGQGGWEQIEMEDMMSRDFDEDDDE